MYGLTLTTGPTYEPITPSEAKLHARIDLTAEDSLVADWIKSAREYVEEMTGRKFAAQSWKMTLNCWPDVIRLPLEPVSAVTSVKYYAHDGTLTTMTVDVDYQAWLSHSPPLIAAGPNTVWPTLESDRVAPIEVVFVTGYTAATIPGRAKEAIYQLVTYYSENRGDGRDPTPNGIPLGAKRLIDSLWTGAY